MPNKVELTMLNGMAGSDIAAAIDRHVALHLRWLDLKDAIFGKSVTDLTDDQARQVRALADNAGLAIHCMSTGLFFGNIEIGADAFAKASLDTVARTIEIARILKPAHIRLLGAWTERRDQICDSTEYVLSKHPWLIEQYREAIDQITSAGFPVVIENEVHHCIWTKPQEILSFFAALNRPAARLIWDIQNLWQMGTFPSLDVYRSLRPLIAMVHLKGGQGEKAGGPLRWCTGLAEATWPVLEVLRAVVADGASPVICLNPSHGERKEGYDYNDVVGRDIDYLRRNIPEIAR